MFKWIVDIFKSPHITDLKNERSVILLHVALKYTLLATIVVTVIAFYAGWPLTSIISLLLCFILVSCLLIMRAGHVKSASLVATLAMMLVAAVLAYYNDGINDIAILVFPGIIVIAALFLNRKIFLFMTVMVLVTIVLIPVLRQWNNLPNLHEEEIETHILTAGLILTAIAVGVRQLFGYLLETLEHLQINEKKYRSIFNNIHDVYFEMDTAGNILEISPSIEELLSIKRENLINRSILSVYKNRNVHHIFMERLKTNHLVRNFEVQFNDYDRCLHNVSINAVLHKNEQGQPEKIVGSIRDITNQRALEEQLIQSQKLESIGRLAGGVAHDFNNLLTIINGHCELAIEKYRQDNGSLEPDLEAIQTAGQKAAGLTRQLLAFSRKQVYQPKTIDPAAVISNLEKMVRRLIGEDIEISINQSNSMQTLINADPTQIEQIIINLLVNSRDALKAKASGDKKITIDTGITSLNKSYAQNHPDCTPGSYFILSVSDSGIGMRPEVKKQIFEPFFTTKSTGTGLGLSMVYGLVRQQNGFINVYSEEGIGTTIRIYWPLINSDEERHKAPAEQQNFHGTECILLVEDDQQVREYAATVLEKYGYRVLKSADGYHAAEVYREQPGRIDLVITDLIMPRMNGMALGELVRSIRPDAKILYISGYTDTHITHNEILQKGINYLQKPFTSKDLGARVREIFNQPQ